MSMRFPTLFLSHGAPTLLIEPTPTHAFLQRLGQELGRPRAILCLSAHWTTPQPLIGSGAYPGMIYDFYGFPDELYRVDYPAPGAPALAQQVVDLLGMAGFAAELDPNRGYDHGAWVPLKLMYPEAGVPLVQLSVQPNLPASYHLAVGAALQPLRDAGVLIVGSGSATHNLRDYFVHPADTPPLPYAVAFNDWLKEAVTTGDSTALVDYLRVAPEARHNHPTPEHYLPLLGALGAAGGGPGRVVHDDLEHGMLAMTAFLWD